MTDLYLIAHKVRGEAAFDVAIMLDALDEDGDPIWIIPTSGHRAFPYWQEELRLLIDWPMQEINGNPMPSSMPPSLPDHYACNDRPVRCEKQPSLLDRLNLKPKLPPIVRRI